MPNHCTSWKPIWFYLYQLVFSLSPAKSGAKYVKIRSLDQKVDLWLTKGDVSAGVDTGRFLSLFSSFFLFSFCYLIFWGVVSERANLDCQQLNHRVLSRAVFMTMTRCFHGELFPLYWGNRNPPEVK